MQQMTLAAARRSPQIDEWFTPLTQLMEQCLITLRQKIVEGDAIAQTDAQCQLLWYG